MSVAKAEGYTLHKCSAETIEGMNSMKGGELKNSKMRLALWAGINNISWEAEEKIVTKSKC